jgi:hypothetical protein
MREISADYVGAMRKLVEATTGATCLFLQGAAGNINPVEMRHSFEPARRLGAMLGGEVVKVFEGVSAGDVTGLAHASAEIELPPMRVATVEEGERSVAELRANVERLRADGASEGSLHWATSRLQRAERMLAAAQGGPALASIPAELCALRFGEAAVVTAPGEIFCETGMEVKRRSPIPQTLYTGYVNGTIGYVPTPESYPEGGYEVTHACRVGPESAGMIRDRSLELLDAVVAH